MGVLGWQLLVVFSLSISWRARNYVVVFWVCWTAILLFAPWLICLQLASRRSRLWAELRDGRADVRSCFGASLVETRDRTSRAMGTRGVPKPRRTRSPR